MIAKIIEFIGNNPIVSTAGSLLAGLAINQLAGLILGQFWPDKAIISAIRKVDANLEKFKVKYPEAGKQLEDRVIATLKDAIEIVSGKK